MIEKVYESGINLFDTANLYVYPDFWRILKLQSPLVCQDEILMRAFGSPKIGGRENIILAHKTGVELQFFPKLSVVGNGQRSFIREQCEATLKRCNTSYIDLLYLHRIDQNIPIEITMLELKLLVKEGKVNYVGLSECSADTLRRAHKIHPISCVQVEF